MPPDQTQNIALLELQNVSLVKWRGGVVCGLGFKDLEGAEKEDAVKATAVCSPIRDGAKSNMSKTQKSLFEPGLAIRRVVTFAERSLRLFSRQLGGTERRQSVLCPD